MAASPESLRRPSSLGRRAATAAWGLPVVAGCLWVGGWPLAVAAGVLAVVCLREFWPLGRALGAAGPLRWELAVSTGLVLAGAALGPRAFSIAVPVAVAGVVVGGVVRAAATSDAEHLRAAMAGTAWATLALLYIPSLLGYVLRLRAVGPFPLRHTLLFVGLVWLADVVAFLVGGAAGRRRLAPGISPAKTVEGAIAALVVTGAVGAVAAGAMAGLPAVAGAVVGLVLAALGLLGDLWESVLKRAAGVKDSGAAVPGHGGVLDRFDSLLLASPGGYWLLAMLHVGHAVPR